MSVTVNISHKTVARLKPCKKHLANFMALFPDGINDVAWTRKLQVSLMRKGFTQCLLWAAKNGLLPLYTTIYDADFSGVDFNVDNTYHVPGFCFVRCNFTGAKSSPGNVKRCTFIECIGLPK